MKDEYIGDICLSPSEILLSSDVGEIVKVVPPLAVLEGAGAAQNGDRRKSAAHQSVAVRPPAASARQCKSLFGIAKNCCNADKEATHAVTSIPSLLKRFWGIFLTLEKHLNVKKVKVAKNCASSWFMVCCCRVGSVAQSRRRISSSTLSMHAWAVCMESVGYISLPNKSNPTSEKSGFRFSWFQVWPVST